MIHTITSKKHKETIQNYVHELGQRGALDELIEDGQRQVDEAQIYEGAPTSSKGLEKTPEHPISLSEIPICAAGEIFAEGKVGRDESDHSDGTNSVLAFHTGTLVGVCFESIMLQRVGVHHRRWFTLPDELKRPHEDYAQELKRAWKRLLKDMST